MNEMLDLIKFIVGTFAEKPEDVDYIVEENGNLVNVTVVLDEEDMGKVIGRQGRIVKQIRILMRAVAQRKGKKVSVEIMD